MLKVVFLFSETFQVIGENDKLRTFLQLKPLPGAHPRYGGSKN